MLANPLITDLEVTYMFCPNCKQSFPDNERFCSDCGHPLEKEVKGTLWIPTVVLGIMFAAGFLVWYLV